MDKYEYKKDEFTYNSEDEYPRNIITVMNSYGSNGWEIIHISKTDRSIEKRNRKIIRIEYELFMKRKY